MSSLQMAVRRSPVLAEMTEFLSKPDGRVLATAWLAGSALTVLVWQYIVWPFDDGHAGTARWSAFEAALLLWLVGIAVAVVLGVLATTTDAPRLRVRSVVIAAGLPVVASVVFGATLQDDHRIQRDAMTTFEQYTEHFPHGVLAPPWIEDRTERYVTVCAQQTTRRPTTHFCAELIVGNHGKRSEVVGGFRFRSQDQDVEAPAGLVSAPFDCFGDAIQCVGS